MRPLKQESLFSVEELSELEGLQIYGGTSDTSTNEPCTGNNGRHYVCVNVQCSHGSCTHYDCSNSSCNHDGCTSLPNIPTIEDQCSVKDCAI